jgi:hypothetical protein
MLDEGRLSGAVAAHERYPVAFMYFEIDLPQDRPSVREIKRQRPDVEKRRLILFRWRGV